jgi:hypothetical protein
MATFTEEAFNMDEFKFDNICKMLAEEGIAY